MKIQSLHLAGVFKVNYVFHHLTPNRNLFGAYYAVQVEMRVTHCCEKIHRLLGRQTSSCLCVDRKVAGAGGRYSLD